MSARTMGRWLSHRDADALVRETHHRVSNHLQILASLIGLQAREHPLSAVREALLDVRRRVLAIARLNTGLQQAQDSEMLEMSRLMAGLESDLRLCFETDGGPSLSLHFDVEPGEAPVDTALTLMLIVNELITNAVKHTALPHGGRILVTLKRDEHGDWRLTVSDDGPGPPPDAFTQGDHGLGLVQNLVRKLKGTIEVDKGVRVRFR
jgi:two-component sensor histidine kinase